jgi:hypothetical protein
VSFTPFQRLVAQLTLEAIADLGFALGGGQALHAHGYGDRLSLDLDFYVTRFDQELFDRAETATLAALRARGYTAQVGHSDTWLRQILVNDPTTAEQVVLDLGHSPRNFERLTAFVPRDAVPPGATRHRRRRPRRRTHPALRAADHRR